MLHAEKHLFGLSHCLSGDWPSHAVCWAEVQKLCILQQS